MKEYPPEYFFADMTAGAIWMIDCALVEGNWRLTIAFDCNPSTFPQGVFATPEAAAAFAATGEVDLPGRMAEWFSMRPPAELEKWERKDQKPRYVE